MLMKYYDLILPSSLMGSQSGKQFRFASRPRLKEFLRENFQIKICFFHHQNLAPIQSEDDRRLNINFV